MKKNKIIILTSQAVFLFTAVIGFYFSGCSNSATSTGTIPPVKNQGRTEAEFSRYTDLKADAGAVIAISLEGLNSPLADDGDTGPIGEDIIPYTYTETAEHKFTVGDSSSFKMKLVSDATGLPVLELNNNMTALVTIPAGNYKMHLISLFNYSAAKPSNMVYIQINRETVYNGSGGVNYSPDDLNRFIKQGGCQNCDLSNADFSNMRLEGSYASNGNFTGAKFAATSLRSMLFAGCKFDNANFYRALSDYEGDGVTFNGCTFKNANLTFMRGPKLEIYKSTFENCDLSNARFIKPDIDDTDFLRSNLQNFAISGNLTNVRFDGVNAKRMIFETETVTGSRFRNTNLDSCRVSGSFCSSTMDNTCTYRYYSGSASCFPPPPPPPGGF